MLPAIPQSIQKQSAHIVTDYPYRFAHIALAGSASQRFSLIALATNKTTIPAMNRTTISWTMVRPSDRFIGRLSIDGILFFLDTFFPLLLLGPGFSGLVQGWTATGLRITRTILA
jgi:hypothetical protein